MENVTKYFTFVIEFHHHEKSGEKFDEINECWRFHKQCINYTTKNDQSWK